MLLTMTQTTRLNKYLAAAGIASRRGAEDIIAQGRVQINHITVTSPAIAVHHTDQVSVDGVIIRSIAEPKIWRYHKPVGLICSHADPQGRPTIFEHLPKNLGRVMSVGRLDLNSEGLLLLTNNGDISRYLEHPSNQISRHYKVRIHGVPSRETLRCIKNGVTIDGIAYQGANVKIIKQTQGTNCWIHITLHEGKNREIRKIFQHFGHHVSRLIRTSYGEFELGELLQTEVMQVSKHDVATLYKKINS